MTEINNCPDCAANPGTIHSDGCDVQRCSVCGGQRLQCECAGHDESFARWTGLWPGTAEAKTLGVDLNDFYLKGYYKLFFIKPDSNHNQMVINGVQITNDGGDITIILGLLITQHMMINAAPKIPPTIAYRLAQESGMAPDDVIMNEESIKRIEAMIEKINKAIRKQS